MKEIIIRHFPQLGKYKRYLVAFFSSLTKKKSYSQFQEDIYIYSNLKKYDLKNSFYVDVGANHPTDISNTYLLYKNGFRGLVIEPNQELIKLFKIFRPKDIALAIGASNQNRVLAFHISKTPVLSSFQKEVSQYSTQYVPVMRLDDILINIPFEYINLLSIDVEGMNYEVLQGAAQTLEKTLLLCIEYDDQDDQKKYEDLIGERFKLQKTYNCNLIYLNQFIAEKYRLHL